ncbi:AMP-binding protein, partial [Streptomyces triticagri]|uniref:AMP-binding protein n=1 Tax=Streptomyces triticagri TaxID=2293568 RepID=UPI001F48ACA0
MQDKPVVALLAGPGVPFIGGVLGVLGAGGAYLPLDPEAPQQRNAGLLQDAGASAVLAGPECLEAAHGIAGDIPVLPLTLPEDADAGHELPALGEGLDLAYVMFTSGSTGRPKGAMVHRVGM